MYYPATLLEEQTPTAKRAPEALQGLEWVVGVQRTPGDHPSGPVGPCRALPVTSPGMPPQGQ